MSAIEKHMRSGYEQIYERLIPKLGECDFSKTSGELVCRIRQLVQWQ